MRKLIVGLTMAGTLLAQATKAPAQKTAPKTATTKAAAPKTVAPKPSLLDPATLNRRATATYKARFVTTKGDFVVEVTREWAPFGADRFYNLVRNGFFDNAHFFRVLKGFVVQFGIHADPKVARAWMNANIKDDPVRESNKKGTLVFATAGPNTRTTQLFINLGDNSSNLDPQGFSPFGKVIEGMEVVEQLYNGYGEAPNQGRIQGEGKMYLDKNFPRLDSVKTARIVPPPPAVPKTSAPKPAAPKTDAKK